MYLKAKIKYCCFKENIHIINKLLIGSALLFITGYAISQTTKIEAIVANKAPNWNVAYQKDFGKGKGTIREFVPKGEKIKKWKHLATIQFIEGEIQTPKEFMQKLKRKMIKRCENTKWDVIYDSKYSITYEWSIDSCSKNKDQHEIARIMQGNDGLHRIAYSEKKKVMDQDEKKLWLSVIKDAYVANGSPDNPVTMESQ